MTEESVSLIAADDDDRERKRDMAITKSVSLLYIERERGKCDFLKGGGVIKEQL